MLGFQHGNGRLPASGHLWPEWSLCMRRLRDRERNPRPEEQPWEGRTIALHHLNAERDDVRGRNDRAARKRLPRSSLVRPRTLRHLKREWRVRLRRLADRPADTRFNKCSIRRRNRAIGHVRTEWGLVVRGLRNRERDPWCEKLTITRRNIASRHLWRKCCRVVGDGSSPCRILH